jgi:uncharacterized damage-inducible protein DinB
MNAPNPLPGLLRMNTRLLLNALEGFPEGSARVRLEGRTNHVAFLLVHLVDARYFMALLCGLELENPLSEEFAHVTSVEEAAEYPTLEQLESMWTEVGGLLHEHMASTGPEAWRRDTGRQFPNGDPSLAGAMAFLLEHEIYHIGQVGMIRRALGLESLKWPSSSG